MQKVVDFAVSPVGLGYIALAIIVLFTVMKNLAPNKGATIDKVEGIVYKVFNFVEKAIPDSLPGETTLSKSLSKADLFAKKFCEEYNKKYGKVPGQEELTAATTIVEKLVYAQNAQK